MHGKITLSLKLIEAKFIIFSHITFFNENFSHLLVIQRKMVTVTFIAIYSMCMEMIVGYFKPLSQYYHGSKESHENIVRTWGLQVEIWDKGPPNTKMRQHSEKSLTGDVKSPMQLAALLFPSPSINRKKKKRFSICFRFQEMTPDELGHIWLKIQEHVPSFIVSISVLVGR
jgi:hypothetical protein